MLGPKYVVRLDDACPYMDRNKWTIVEKILDKYEIKPIVAVVPENKDPKLIKDSYDKNFWRKVRNWQNKGWYIAMHGYNHLYISKNSGFLPFSNKSEFAGLPYEEQAKKIQAGWKIFQDEGIECKIWVAPSHTFDLNTLKALKELTTIDTISDGIGLFPFKKYGFKWIPVQMWRFRKLPLGVWTICLHPNEMSEEDFKKMDEFLKREKKHFILLEELKYKSYSVFNFSFELIYKLLWRIKRLLKTVR